MEHCHKYVLTIKLIQLQVLLINNLLPGRVLDQKCVKTGLHLEKSAYFSLFLSQKMQKTGGRENQPKIDLYCEIFIMTQTERECNKSYQTGENKCVPISKVRGGSRIS